MYESITGDAEVTWRHVTSDDSQRHLSVAKDNSVAGQRKAHTLPRQHERVGTNQPISATLETETGLGKYVVETGGKSRKGNLVRSSADDLRLLETSLKVCGAFETETTPHGVTRPAGEAVSGTGSVGPVFRRGRRSRPSVLAGRRTSLVTVARRGKPATSRPGPCSGRISPLGAAVPLSKEERPAIWMDGTSDGKESDEDSYVTACNSTPRLSRACSSAHRDRATQHPQNRKYSQTGNGRRRRRRRLRYPISHAAAEVRPSTADHPGRLETAHVVVPMPVVVLLLGAYVLGGAAMFRRVYGAEDWPSAVFVSLAAVLTVGGWYPDRGNDDDDDVGGRLVDARFVYATWVVVGLVVVSACLHLVVQTLSSSTCCPCCRRSVAERNVSCKTSPTNHRTTPYHTV